MKIFVIILMLLTTMGCSTGPIRIRVTNCVPIGGGFYECEDASLRYHERK